MCWFSLLSLLIMAVNIEYKTHQGSDYACDGDFLIIIGTTTTAICSVYN